MAVRNGKIEGEMMVRLRGTAEETKASYWAYPHPEAPETFAILFKFQEIKKSVNSGRYKVGRV